MALPPLRDRLTQGEFILCGWSSLVDPVVHEALAASFDAVVFDAQHGLHDTASLREAIARTSFAGKPAIVRVPVEDRALAARSLDFGAAATIMPMIEGPEDARRFVHAVKYPPRGLRSFGPARALDLHGYGDAGDYTAVADTQTLAIAMIETRAALENLHAILAIEGLDGVFVGPSDLSIALSPDNRRDPRGPAASKAIEEIRAAAAAAGKVSAIYAGSVDEACTYRDLGFGMVTLSSDIGLLKAGISAALAGVRGWG